MDCGKITKAFVGGACGKLPIGGTGTRVILFNYADIASHDTASDGTITNITMHDGKKGFLFETIENSPQGTSTFNAGTYIPNYGHSVTLRVFKDDINARSWVNELTYGRFVAAVERREAGDAHWEIYGIESGLKMSENAYDTSYSDNVVFAPVLSSDDTSKESAVPAIFFDGTSASSTEQKLLALCVTAE